MMRLFLTNRHEGLFEGLPPGETREAYLRRVFGQEIIFKHWKKTFVYTHFEAGLPDYVTGVIGKEHRVTVGDSPSEFYRRKDIPDWQTANLFIDPSGEMDGQKVAMQEVRVVGSSLNVFRSLVDHINSHGRNADWTISVNVISQEAEFWSAVKAYSGRIGELDLTFVAPNIWKGKSETEEALKKLHSQNNAEEVEVRLKNSEKALNPDSEAIRESVEYIAKGGGSVVLKEDGRTTLYSSERNAVTTTPPFDAQIEEADPQTLRRLAEELFRKKSEPRK
jgi:hypothetical protein